MEPDGKKRIFVNEVNDAGFTPLSMYPKLWEGSGLSYKELISGCLAGAGSGKRREQNLVQQEE